MLKRPIVQSLSILLPLITLYGCGGDSIAEGPSAQGEYDVCEYTRGLGNSGYGSATISYPCATEDGPFPATTVIGGFTNTKNQMTWISDNMTSHGFVVIRLTPNFPFGLPSSWVSAQLAGYEQLIIENNEGSPIEGLIDEEAIGMVGYSFGGRGALFAADELGDRIKAVVAFAPFNATPSTWALPDIEAATLIAIGSEDTVAYPRNAMGQFDGLPDILSTIYAEVAGSSHLDFINSGNYHNKYKTLATSWLSMQLEGDDSYATYLYGDKHQEHVDDRWFSDYITRN
ncbi:hypothetical protein A9Q99_11175 [Gammaproteobacteria bacterium 45_16_T64]|nr:hypothetical protein A9Q99_11175 [Gammaproteobacteria bacterium 45_16_T64]